MLFKTQLDITHCVSVCVQYVYLCKLWVFTCSGECVCMRLCVCVFSGETKFPVTLNNYSKSFKLKSFPQRHFLSFFVPESQQMNQFLSQQRHFQHFRTTTQKGSAIFLLFDLCKNCFVFFFFIEEGNLVETVFFPSEVVTASPVKDIAVLPCT